jgi:hypothetical protein
MTAAASSCAGQIDHAARRGMRYARNQVERRPQALVAEAQVLLGIPGGASRHPGPARNASIRW